MSDFISTLLALRISQSMSQSNAIRQAKVLEEQQKAAPPPLPRVVTWEQKKKILAAYLAFLLVWFLFMTHII